MNQKIIPAVLSDKLEDYQKAFELFETFPGNEWVHIDIMDGKFVETISADLSHILTLPTTLKKQVHLMVEDPISYLKLCENAGVNEVVFHFESKLKNLRELTQFDTIEIYLGLHPHTSADTLNIEILEYVKGVLILSVIPGKQGNEFLPTELEEITKVKSLSRFESIILDGHVDLETIQLNNLKDLPVRDFVIGSAIIKTTNPLNSYQELSRILLAK